MNTWDDYYGYDMADPKHPSWLERMEAAAEAKRDMEKENGSGDVSCSGNERTGESK